MNGRNAAGEASVARRYRTILSLLRLIVSVAASAILLASHALAQGCAMCYQNAAASGTQGRTTLQQGILILLLPALTVFVGVFVVIYRRRNLTR
jgi:hypothetical protein